ncbi:MAG: ribosome small subunit-dependent GTPase A, partial [Giesbergeria sp.]
PTELARCMPDIAAHATDCRFYNCTHLHEPGCGVISVIKNGSSTGEISAIRYSIYSELFKELGQTRY